MENKKDNFFDKYELYAFGNSIYCYAGSTVLKNKLNITDQGEFFKAESELAFAGLLELQINPIKGNFDKKHLYAIHKFLFDPIYDFAGQTRREDISKGNTKFCVWEYIDDQLDELFVKIKQREKDFRLKSELADFIAYVLAELNIIHPFREGNGRAIREFVREYALSFAFDIDWSKVDKTQLMDAMIESVFDSKSLKSCLLICLERK